MSESLESKQIVLLVDDEPEALDLCKRLLRQDYELMAFTSGEEALEAARGVNLAAAVVDQRMPGMSGDEVMAELAKVQPDAARIAVTAYADLESITSLVNVGRVHAFVLKPWEGAQLKQTVSREVALYQRKREVLLLQERLSQEHSDMRDLLAGLDPTFQVPGSNDELKYWKQRLRDSVSSQVEKLFLEALTESGSASVARLARRAKMNRTFLYRLLKKHGVIDDAKDF